MKLKDFESPVVQVFAVVAAIAILGSFMFSLALNVALLANQMIPDPNCFSIQIVNNGEFFSCTTEKLEKLEVVGWAIGLFKLFELGIYSIIQ